jgi:hypothetical protein
MTMMLMTVPLFSTVLPPLFDYPNHLARLYFVDGGRQCISTPPCDGSRRQTSRKI